MDNIPMSLTGAVSSGNSHLAHLHACDTALAFVSRAPVDEIEAFRKRIGWQMPWFSTMDDFNADFEVPRAIRPQCLLLRRDRC
jgi:predicted dithiol-disulfide oxidoreductase (DUF899 family)